MLVPHFEHCRLRTTVSLLPYEVTPRQKDERKKRGDRGEKKMIVEVIGDYARVRKDEIQVEVDQV